MNKKELEEHRRMLIELNKELQQKINKTIEYLNKWNKNHKEQHGYNSIHCDELLKILGDKENE